VRGGIAGLSGDEVDEGDKKQEEKEGSDYGTCHDDCLSNFLTMNRE